MRVLNKLLLLWLFVAVTLAQMGYTNASTIVDATNLNLGHPFTSSSIPITSSAPSGAWAALKIKIAQSGGSSVNDLTLTLYERTFARSIDISTSCQPSNGDTTLCSVAAELPITSGDYYLIVHKGVVWGDQVKVEIFYCLVEVYPTRADLNAQTNAVSTTTYYEVIRGEFVHMISVEDTPVPAGQLYEVLGVGTQGNLDIDIFRISESTPAEQMTLTGSNLLTEAPSFNNTVLSVAVPSGGLSLGLYLLVLKRGGGDAPSGTTYSVSVWTVQGTPPCPFAASVQGPSSLFTCTTTTSTTSAPAASSFAAISSQLTALTYSYTNTFSNLERPFNVATFELGSLSAGNWVSVQIIINNAMSTSDPGIADLMLNIYSARNTASGMDLSTLCDGLGSSATQCVFTHQITASSASTHYLTIGVAVDFSTASTAILQTYQVKIVTYSSAANLVAGTNAMTTIQNTDALRNDVVRLVYYSTPATFRVSVSSATSSTVVYMYRTTDASTDSISNYMQATGSSVLTATSNDGEYDAVVQPGFYIIAVTSGSTEVATLTLNAYYEPGKSCHFNSGFADSFMVYTGCTAATVSAPTLTTVTGPSVVDYKFSNDFTSSTNPFYQIRYDLGNREASNYLVFKLQSSASAPNLDTITISLRSGLSDTTGTSITHGCASSATTCSFSYTITSAANYWVLISQPSVSAAAGNVLETLHISINAFTNLAAINAGNSAISGFPLLKTDAQRQQVLKVIWLPQASSFAPKMTNVPADASVSTNKESGWALMLYNAGNSLGSTMSLSGSNLLSNEAYANSGGELSYRTMLPAGWYVLGATTPATTSAVNNIGLQYFNRPFSCHFDNTWADDFMTYSGCTQASPVPTAPDGFTSVTCTSVQSYNAPTESCVACSSLATGNCTSICPTYYFSGSACVSCTGLDSNCVTCASGTVCSTCASGFTIDSGSSQLCMDSTCNISRCIDCASASNCRTCTAGYRVASGLTSCEVATCTINNCLNCDGTSCGTCESGYSLSSDRSTCTLVCNDENCASCSTASTCTTCKTGFTINSSTGLCALTCDVSNCATCVVLGTCVTCDSGYLVSSDGTTCNLQCTDTNCQTCNPAATCTACNTGYQLVSNACTLALCNIAYCQTCATSTTCATCQQFTTISSDSSSCPQDCIAIANIANCEVCATSTTCGTCSGGFTLSSNSLACNKACSISNCETCLNANLCLHCASGYTTSSDSTSCVFNCGIENCQSCNSTNTCGTCSPPFSTNTAATVCQLSCPSDSYAVDSTTCATCNSAITNCATCSSATVCLTCYDFYYLANSGQCGQCSSAIANCQSCSSATVCTLCQTNYVLKADNTCELRDTCNVNNCDLCVSGNSAACSICNTGYTLSGTTCTLTTCSVSGQVFSSITNSCACPDRTYVQNNACTACTIDNCVTCNAVGCETCEDAFYVSNAACVACSSNCASCTTGTSCLECDVDYDLEGGACVAKTSDNGNTPVGGAIATCPPGCKTCFTNSNNVIVCDEPLEGYSFDSSGNIVRCDDSCKTCSPSNAAQCTSCFGASRLIGTTCSGCSDSNAASCAGNVAWSDSCISGFVPVNGLCTACAANCETCASAGAGNCDDGGCGDGYVVVTDTTNCTQCFEACATCNVRSPDQCLTCVIGSYIITSNSSCETCPTGCQACSSATNCSTCLDGFVSISELCYAQIAFPCATQNTTSCLSCYVGYTLVNGNCQTDTSCSASSTCVSCPTSQYLSNGQCNSCSTDSATCDYCKPTAPAECQQCVVGYYLSGTTCTLCSSAMTGCSRCRSSSFCIRAAPTYYIRRVRGRKTGEVGQCKSTCATCRRFPACRTCIDNYVKFGGACIYFRNVQSTCTFTADGSWFDPNASNAQNRANALLQINGIIAIFMVAAGITDFDQIVTNSLTTGSITTNMNIAATPSDDFNTFSNNLVGNINNNNMPGLQVVSASNVINNQETSDDSVNLGLILGISIPLVILLVVIIIFVKIKGSEDTTVGDSEYTEKEIQDYDL